MKPIDVNLSTYIDFDVESNDKVLKFKVCNHVRILKYKNIFAKGYTPNCSEKTFPIKRTWTHVISNLNGEEVVGTFMKNT